VQHVIIVFALLQRSTKYTGGIIVGLRVVKEEGWKLENQNGQRFLPVGTVVEADGESGPVVVVWDKGKRETCQCGFDGKNGLRVLDNAAAGSVCCSLFSDFTCCSSL